MPKNHNYLELFFTLGPDYRLREYDVKGAQSEKFKEFVDRNIDRFNSYHNLPDYWMFQYNIPREVLPLLQSESCIIGPDFFQKISPVLVERGITPVQIVRLRDAAYCRNYDISLFSAQAEPAALQKSDGYRFAMQYMGDTSRFQGTLPRFDTFTAVEKEQGLLLFSHTPNGADRFNDLLDYHLLHFFNPQLPETELNVYEIPRFDPSMENMADRFNIRRPNDQKGRYAFDEIPQDMFAPRSLLQYAIKTRCFDLHPTVNMYERYARDAGISSYYDQYSYDIVHLLNIRENGLTAGGQLEVKYGLFAHAEDFEKITDMIVDPYNSDDLKQTYQDKARKLAASILTDQYPDVRGGHTQSGKQIPETSELLVPAIPRSESRGIKR